MKVRTIKNFYFCAGIRGKRKVNIIHLVRIRAGLTAMAGRLQKEWIESLIMRGAGCIIVVVLLYRLYLALAAL